MSDRILFKKWNKYLSDTFGSFSIDVINNCITNAIFATQQPLSIYLRQNDRALETKTIEEIKEHCDQLGLSCELIGQTNGKYTSGSCMPYNRLMFNITGYPYNIHLNQWGGVSVGDITSKITSKM